MSSSSSSSSNKLPAITSDRVNVRYDGNVKKWAVINDQGNPIEHIDRAVMLDVTFTTIETRTVQGCLEHRDHLGVANGILKRNATTRATKLRNLDFKGKEGFVCPEGTELTTAKILVLNPDRRAVYK